MMPQMQRCPHLQSATSLPESRLHDPLMVDGWDGLPAQRTEVSEKLVEVVMATAVVIDRLLMQAYPWPHVCTL